MKRYICSLTLMAGLLAGCSDFLDRTPISQPSSSAFYQTPQDILTAVNGAYAVLQGGRLYGSNLHTMLESRSDNVFDNDPSAGAGLRYDIDRFIEPTTNTVLRDTWEGLYEGVYRCNSIINRIDAIPMEEGLRNRYRGEAQFIRALLNFHLVQLWGRVPLVVEAASTGEARNHRRNEVSEVYQAIENDLVAAAQGLPASFSGADLGRATSIAARTLLGKVYLTQGKFAEAAAVLKEVIDSPGPHRLLDNIADVFSVNNKMNAEIVFAVRYRKGGINEGHGLWFGSVIGELIESDLREAYEPHDARLDLLTTVQPPSVATRVPKKYYDEPAPSDVGNDFPVLRFADVLLMYAEVLNELGYTPDGDAFRYLNTVRIRAGVSPLSASDLPDQANFRKAIWHERRLEFALENQRWYDLLRTGTAVESLANVGLNVPSFRLLYPIPQSEIEVMNNAATFPQNPGY